MRARRIDLGLLQRDVAARVGVSTASVNGWELTTREPELRFMPAIIEFLGYDLTAAIPEGDIGKRLVLARRAKGLTQEALAATLGIDPSTLAEWEAGRRRTRPSRRVTGAIEHFLAGQQLTFAAAFGSPHFLAASAGVVYEIGVALPTLLELVRSRRTPDELAKEFEPDDAV